ncbi:MAG: tetratricopeptide repeat protein [Aquincola sp.]|nr:tetratricopeptide repeat protein [Aquincola sp.]
MKRRYLLAICALLVLPSSGTLAQAAQPANSALDAPLFYELLLGEMDLRAGDAGAAYAKFIDVARRTGDESAFRRAVEVALQARSGDQAIAAARAWRQAVPESMDALRFELQILAALNRGGELSEPIKALLARTPPADVSGVIAGLPRLFARASDKRQAAEQLDEALKPFINAEPTRTAARVASARGWAQAGETARALELAERANADDPAAPGPALLALDLMAGPPPQLPAAEKLVTSFLQRPGAEVAVRMAYVRVLSTAQRYVEAESQLRTVTREQPSLPGPWLSLGALQLELRQPRDADTSIQRFLQLRTSATEPAVGADDGDDDEDGANAGDGGRTQAWLMLAQAADMRGDAKAASGWLDKIDDPQRALEVQTRRATLLAKQGKVREARTMVQQVPERKPEDARAKLVAESTVLREVKRWPDAHAVLVTANERFPGDTDLLYEQAMVAEKLARTDEMERVLRKVIELKPDHHHAYNALGYSLAERNQRLPEARELIHKALELAPSDPFITDSMGWVEYRLGNNAAALVHLQRAYASRPDTEIAAHLGEVLWASGQREEARRVWREGRSRDADNEVLRETLNRLQVRL